MERNIVKNYMPTPTPTPMPMPTPTPIPTSIHTPTCSGMFN